jgi:hypothetical protein
MQARSKVSRLLLGVLSVSLLATIGTNPALAARPSSGKGASCPKSKAIENFPEAENVGASFANSGTTTTYTFDSFLDEDTDGDGVPGLIEYCVYPTPPQSPTTIDPQAVGASGADWVSRSGLADRFSFVRPDGNKSNIPLDGTSTTMGTATWTTVPEDQAILLHINDPAVCGASGTCFVRPGERPSVVCDAGDTSVAFDAFPTDFARGCPPPPSVAFEANGVVEFGDAVGLATGGDLQSLTVDFQSYGCSDSGHWNLGGANACVTTPGASFTFPVNDSGITARIYALGPGDTVGAELASATFTGPIPFRPSADPVNCPNGDPIAGYEAGSQWFDAATGQCLSSISVPIEFTFPAGITLPSQVIWTVSFNTTHYGYAPIGEATACFASGPGCGYDSLNVGVKTYANAPYSGTDLNPDGVFWNVGPFGAPANPAGLASSPTGWSGFLPLARIVTAGP